MRGLTPPNRIGDYSDLAEGLRRYRYGGKLKGYGVTPAEIVLVTTLYDICDTNHGQTSPTLVNTGLDIALTNAIAEAFNKTQGGGALRHIRSSILVKDKLCQLCDMDHVAEIDHFLPISVYPALAIYVRNLVPLCEKCNERKSARLEAEPGLTFVHPYFDNIPIIPFLQANIELNETALSVTFDVDPTAPIDAHLGERLNAQIRALSLHERHRREVNDYLSSLVGWLKTQWLNGGHPLVSDFLSKQGSNEGRQRHINHWKTILCHTLSSHANFCDRGFSVLLPEQERTDLLNV